MNGKEFMDYILTGKSPVVRFTIGINRVECDFDPEMMARVIGVSEEDDCLRISFDIKEHEAFNIPLMPTSYYDEMRNPTLKWIESKCYPKDGRTHFYIELNDPIPFELVEENGLYAEFVQAGVSQTYTEWLEQRLLELRNK